MPRRGRTAAPRTSLTPARAWAADWGHYDLGYRRPAGDKEILTPELDSLIASGLELTQAYSHFWCTPSRSSLLSGRLPMHVFQEQGVQFAMGVSSSIRGALPLSTAARLTAIVGA